MKRLPFVPILTAFILLAGVSAGSVPVKTDEPPALWLTISAPPMWDSMQESDIANSFHQRIATKLRQAGFVGVIGDLNRFDDPGPTTPVMEVNLLQWRPERTGGIVCTFGVNLIAGGKNTNLGLFTGAAPQWMTTASHTWELRRGLDDSASRAIDSLIKRLRQEQLLPPSSKKL